MASRIDLLARSLPELQSRGLDTGARQIPITGADGEDAPDFGQTLTTALNGISDVRDQAGDMTMRFLSGDQNVELHQVMAAQSEAGIALDLLVEMRNKLVESYRTLINMQS